ncbi:MAG: hypothetical protein WC595_02355 [Candidatus Nanoarchaeia archaeon]
MDVKKVLGLVMGIVLLLGVIIVSWFFTAPILSARSLQSWLIFGWVIVASLFSILGFEIVRINLK